MSTPSQTNYRGVYAKYVRGTSRYEVYRYGDIVVKDGLFYICSTEMSQGYVPEDTKSGFLLLGAGVGLTGGAAADVNGGTYT